MDLVYTKKSVKEIYKSFFLYPLQLLISTILIILIARGLGPIEFGKYSLCISIVSLVSIPICGGLPNLLIRETAFLNSHKNNNKINDLWVSAFGLILSSTIIIIFIISIINFFLKYGEYNSFSHLLFISTFLIPFIAFNKNLTAINKGIGNAIIGLLSENFFIQIIFIVLYLIILIFGNYSLDKAESIILLNIFSTMMGGLLLYVITIKNFPLKLTLNRFYLYKNLDKFRGSLIRFSIIQIMYSLNLQLDILFLSFFSSFNTVGNYKIIVQLTLICGVLYNVITQIIAPKIAHLYINNQKSELENLLLRVNKISILVAIALSLLILTFGEKVVSKMFGLGFDLDLNVLIVLMIGQLIVVISGFPHAILNMTGNEKLTLNGLYVSVLLNFFLNLILVPKFGALGASLATAFSLFIRNIIHIKMIKYNIGIVNNIVVKKN